MVRYTIRFPDDLYARIKTNAETNRRSIHAEILWQLEQGPDHETGRNEGAAPPTAGHP